MIIRENLDWNEFLLSELQLKEITYSILEIEIENMKVFKSESAPEVPIHPLNLIWLQTERLIGLMPCAKTSGGDNILIVKIVRSPTTNKYTTTPIAVLMDVTASTIVEYVSLRKKNMKLFGVYSVPGAHSYYQAKKQHNNIMSNFKKEFPGISEDKSQS